MKYLNKLEKGFFSFWVLRYKVTYLLAFVIFIMGLFSLNSLPKESDPEVNLPMVTISTKYDWVSAEFIDTEITEELEESIEDIEWISSIDSTSKEGLSTIRVEIYDNYDTEVVISEIEDAVDSTSLPNWVDKDFPVVKQMDFTSSNMFSVIVYADENQFPFEKLLDISEVLKQNTSGKNGIKEVTIDTNTIYDIRVILSKDKLDNLWLSMDAVSNAIKNNHLDSPIWTYDIDGKKFSFKLSWKLKDYSDIHDVNVSLWDGYVKVSDISDIELYYWEEKINKFWKHKESGFNFIQLTYSKLSWENIFDVAPIAKKWIEAELNKSMYEGIKFEYTDDESQSITDDFNSLYQSAFITIILVFLALIFFVWLRESAIATLILPLAFLLAFIVVEFIWETLNQMTTFAFVLAFWIAIDTIIIIVEWAAEKVKQWFHPKTATLIALKEFKSPIIIWTLTTISAFIPILTLPGIMWIFLSFIPLVVFITLVSTLFVSLTIAGAIFVWLSKDKKTYEVFEEREKVSSSEEKELLLSERVWKKLLTSENKSLREKIYDRYSKLYKNSLIKLLKSSKTRLLWSILPIFLLLFSCLVFLPNIGFEIFPSAIKDELRITVTWPDKYTPSNMQSEIEYVEKLLSSVNEIKNYTLSISDNKISASINLTPTLTRKNLWEQNNDELQKSLTSELKNNLWNLGYTIWSRKWKRGPGSSDPVGIFLTTSNVLNYNEMINISEDFEKYLESLSQVSEVNLTTTSSLWEIDFSIKKDEIAILGLTEKDIFNQISSTIRWSTVWTIKWNSNDHDIKIYYDKFLENLSPSDIENINIYSWWETYKAWNLIEYKIRKTSPTIKRGDWDIEVWISAWLKNSSDTSFVQNELINFSENYSFPEGINFKKWWENEENADLINSVIKWVFVAFFLIFTVLVYQFNSYGQPAVILYSVLMSLIWVIFGLYITWNPISMPVWVWFISLMWIVVNDAIIMIDKINKNIWNGMAFKLSIIEWAVSRLNPILVTTITTVAWILPIALQDPFWAGLWFTIAFGLTTWSFMTLFVIPTLYYSLEKRKYRN